MHSGEEKPVERRFEDVELETNDTSNEVSSSSLKITRDSWWDNRKGIAVSLIVNMALFEYGLDQGMVNGFQAMPGFLIEFGYYDPTLLGGYGISTTVQQLMGSLVPVGMFVTTFLAGPISNMIGRKGGLWLGIVFMYLSVTVQIAAINLGGLYAGRVLLGFSNGLLLVCSQLYMQETVPANLRSLSFTFFQFWISFGALIGSVVNNATSTMISRASFRIPLGVLYIVPSLLGIGLFFLPDTPRYLASKGRYDDAEYALRRLRDAAFTDIQVKEEVAEIRNAIELDREITKNIGFLELFQRANRKRTMASVGCGLVSAASGVPFVTQYGVYFFLLSGDTHAFRDGIILLCCGLAGVLSTPLFTGKIGKRPILIFGGLMQSLCMLGMAVAYTVRGIDKVGGKTIIAMSCIYLFFTSATTSPFAWQVAGEVPSQPLRSHTLGLTSAVTFLFGWSITFTIPYFVNPTALNWGAKYGYIWFVTNLLICLFTFFMVPETNKRTLEEIDECYTQRVPIRKFSSYECVGTMNSRLNAVQQYKLNNVTEH